MVTLSLAIFSDDYWIPIKYNNGRKFPTRLEHYKHNFSSKSVPHFGWSHSWTLCPAEFWKAYHSIERYRRTFLNFIQDNRVLPKKFKKLNRNNNSNHQKQKPFQDPNYLVFFVAIHWTKNLVAREEEPSRLRLVQIRNLLYLTKDECKTQAAPN